MTHRVVLLSSVDTPGKGDLLRANTYQRKDPVDLFREPLDFNPTPQTKLPLDFGRVWYIEHFEDGLTIDQESLDNVKQYKLGWPRGSAGGARGRKWKEGFDRTNHPH